MKSYLVIFALSACLLSNAAAVPPTNVGPEEIKRLTLAAALLDYPTEQDKVREALGIPNGVEPSTGSGESEGAKRGVYWLWPLRRSPGAMTALKVFYSNDTKETTGRYPVITAIEVVHHLPDVGSFVADPNEYPLVLASRLKALMKRDGLTPKQITDPKNLPKYWNEVTQERNKESRRALEEKSAMSKHQ